jgi:hypothetical protein
MQCLVYVDIVWLKLHRFYAHGEFNDRQPSDVITLVYMKHYNFASAHKEPREVYNVAIVSTSKHTRPSMIRV